MPEKSRLRLSVRGDYQPDPWSVQVAARGFIRDVQSKQSTYSQLPCIRFNNARICVNGVVVLYAVEATPYSITLSCYSLHQQNPHLSLSSSSPFLMEYLHSSVCRHGSLIHFIKSGCVGGGREPHRPANHSQPATAEPSQTREYVQ